MIVELLYHLNSPAYRRGDDIEDPLHFAPIDWDAKEADDDDLTPSSAKIKDVKLDLATLRKIKDHRRDHRVDRPWGQLFGGRDWTWPYSTHINLHGAAVNGILAGEKNHGLSRISIAKGVASCRGCGENFRVVCAFD